MSLSFKAGILSPLYRNCIFRSDERVMMHDHVSQELAEHGLRWKSGIPPDGQVKFPHPWPPQIPPGRTGQIMTTRG